MVMKRASEQQEDNGRKVLGFGEPKGPGKTTFYMTMPQPLLVFQYDLGSTTVPPGVDPNGVWVQDYPDLSVVDLSAADIKRKREIGDKAAKDLVALLESFKTSSTTGIVKLSDGTSCPRPASLFLDGGSRLDDILVNLICAINNISSPRDMPDRRGN